jgi:benzoate-CoA ligase family protein
MRVLVARVGSALQRSGVRAGDRVVILLPDSIEFAAMYLGAIRAGAVAVPCNPALKHSDFELFLRESEAAVVVADAPTLPEVRIAIETTDRSPKLVLLGTTAAGAENWEEWVASADPEYPPHPTERDDPAFWLWTSGSTGHPRAAVHRHRDWGPLNTGYAEGVLGMRPEDVVFSAAKSFHAYGLGNGTVFPLALGARTIYLRGRPGPESIFATLANERPSLFFGVPTMYAALLASVEATPAFALPGLRYCVSAGEPLPGEIYRRWRERFGVEILDGIGSTEVLHIYISARAGSVRPGSTGTPVDGYAVRIVDESGRDVPPGVIGDLWVRGPSIASGYRHRSTATPLRLREGWLVTGDKFYRDADGYYWYVGRADDMFKSKAEWVSPIVVEGALIEHPAVLESAVVGHVDSDGLTKPRAFVVLRPGNVPTVELAGHVRQSLRGRLPAYAVPRWIEFVPELPKSSTGKLLRYQLRHPAPAPGA